MKLNYLLFYLDLFIIIYSIIIFPIESNFFYSFYLINNDNLNEKISYHPFFYNLIIIFLISGLKIILFLFNIKITITEIGFKVKNPEIIYLKGNILKFDVLRIFQFFILIPVLFMWFCFLFILISNISSIIHSLWLWTSNVGGFVTRKTRSVFMVSLSSAK